jgi:fused signal recognition particle receptor
MFAKIGKALTKTRREIMGRIESIFQGKTGVDEEVLTRLEETLLAADLGVSTTQRFLDELAKHPQHQTLKDLNSFRQSLRRLLMEILQKGEGRLDTRSAKPYVVMMVGVNGVGKTSTIAKLAYRFRQEGKSLLLAAGDTFRAAAVEQLEHWGGRLEIPVIKHQSGSDPAAVAFDAVSAAKARKIDVLIADTAGRLHTQKNLMEEIKKIKRVMGKALPGSPHEILLVVDATTGQNALVQAKQFQEAVGLTGIVLTKLDGTAKGGIVVSIIREFGIPIKFVGVGEGMEDLEAFSAEAFADGLLAYDSGGF